MEKAKTSCLPLESFDRQTLYCLTYFGTKLVDLWSILASLILLKPTLIPLVKQTCVDPKPFLDVFETFSLCSFLFAANP